MAIRRSPGLRTIALSGGMAAAFDGGNARINVYTGAQPATANTAASGTLLGTLTPSSDVFAAPSAGAMALNSVTSDSSADANGTAGWCRFYRTTDTAPGSAGDADDLRMDLLIGTDIAIDNASIVAGGVIALSGWTYTEATGE